MTENKEDKRIYVLSQEKPAKAVIKMGVPLIAGMMIMVLYNFVDTFFIGLMRDDYQLAAVNLAYPVMMISVAVSNMVGAGASSLIARSLGAGDREKACHTLTVGFALTVLNSCIVAGAGVAFLPQIVRLLPVCRKAVSITPFLNQQHIIRIVCGQIISIFQISFFIGQSSGAAGHPVPYRHRQKL